MYINLPINERIRQGFPLYPITVGYSYLQTEVHRPNGAVFHHFMLVNEGEGYFCFNGERRILKAGAVVFIRKAFPVDYGPMNGEFRTSWVTFDGDGVDKLLAYFGLGDFAILHPTGADGKIEEICRLAAANAPIELIALKVYRLTMDFLMFMKKRNEPPVLAKAKAYLEEQYAADVSMEMLSLAVGCSQTLLFRTFRAEEQTTPMEYLRMIRVQRAGQMLIESRLKIFEVARACGFSDVAYFCKVFRAHTGYSPTVYRKNFVD